MDIIAKAKELGTMIAASTEMSNLNRTEEIIENDEKSITLLNDYKLLQVEVVKATKESRGKEVVDSIKERLIGKQEEINNYELTRDYLKAKSDMDRLMQTVNDVIIYAITGQESCSHGNCGSCGGGCK